VIADKFPDDYATIAAWPLPACVAANDLLDSLERARAKKHAEIRRKRGE
jgi:hypothetical protein